MTGGRASYRLLRVEQEKLPAESMVRFEGCRTGDRNRGTGVKPTNA